MNNAASLRNSNFNANLHTVVIAHGWLSNQNTDINPVIRDGKYVSNYIKPETFFMLAISDIAVFGIS
jgi:hypothetical protein